MSTCCLPTTFTFNGPLVTEQYTAAMAAIYGPIPKLEVYYLVDGDYVAAGIFTQIQFDGSNILVDNGGPARGILRVS